MHSRSKWIALILTALLLAPVSQGQSVSDVTVLRQQGQQLLQDGKYKDAILILQKLLEIQEQILSPENVALAPILALLGRAQLEQGDLLQAEVTFTRARDLLEKNPQDNPLDYAKSLNNLALLYGDKGNFVKAASLLTQSIKILEQRSNPNDQELAKAYTSLGVIHARQKHFDKAFTSMDQALKIFEKVSAPDDISLAEFLHNYATLYGLADRPQEAEKLFRRALEIYEKKLPPNHPDILLALSNLAEIEIAKGNYSEAERVHRQVLAAREQTLGLEHPRTLTSLYNVASAQTSLGRVEDAVTTLSRELIAKEKNLTLLLTTGSDSEKREYLADLEEATNFIIFLDQVLAANNTPRSYSTQQALNTILQRKGRVLDALSQQLITLRQSLDAKTQPLFVELTQTRSDLAALVFQGPTDLALDQFQKQVKILEAKATFLEASLNSSNTNFRNQTVPTDWRAVQLRIPSDSALIEFFRYQPVNNKAKKRAENFGPSHYVAYVLRATGDPIGIDLGLANDIDQNTQRMRELLVNKSSTTLEIKQIAQALRAKLLQPLEQHLAGVKQLLLSPDGALNTLPFAALTDQKGNWLLENYTLTYLTSGRDLLRTSTTADGPPIFVAKPIFELTSVDKLAIRPGTRSIDLSDLSYSSGDIQATKAEVEAIKVFFPKATLWIEAEANETNLKKLYRPSILHIATHGFFLKSTDLTENPLLRSGLALAGFNQRQSGTEDGVLTALEVSGLDLQGTQLVVLSACETGLGDVQNGEGVYGLRRALVLAGSQSQVISLWKVDDQATKQLMIGYYQNLQKGQGRSDALRQAQLQLARQSGSERPYYWAAFIPSGDWRPLRFVFPNS